MKTRVSVDNTEVNDTPKEHENDKQISQVSLGDSKKIIGLDTVRHIHKVLI